MSYLRYFCLFVYSRVQGILRCVSALLFDQVVCRMLPVSLDCPVLNVTTVFSKVDLSQSKVY